MGAVDVVVVMVVVALVALALRSLLSQRRKGCSDCGSASSCAAGQPGGSCKAADDMLRRASEAVDAAERDR